MTGDLQQKFSEIDQLLMSVLIASEITHQTPSPQLRQKLAEDFTKIQPLLAPLEKAIQERLRYEEA
jgi:phosphoglycerate-specific signal transduction histidine kinase